MGQHTVGIAGMLASTLALLLLNLSANPIEVSVSYRSCFGYISCFSGYSYMLYKLLNNQPFKVILTPLKNAVCFSSVLQAEGSL